MASANYQLPQDLLAKWAQKTPSKVYLRQPVNREYQELTWGEVYRQVRCLAAAYRALGLNPGDKIAILGKNTAQWFICDFAASVAGLISVPIYFTAGEKTISYILQHSESKAIVLGKLDDTSAAEAAIPDQIITISQPYDTLSCDHQMDDLIRDHEPLEDIFKPELDDVVSYSYTSGSTGNPKGAVLTYRNIAYGAAASAESFGMTEKDRMLSYLPLAHITERVLVEHVSLYTGATITFLESLETFPEDIKSAEPSLFISVPRLWMKFQAGVLAKMPQEKLDKIFRIPLLNRLVKNKIKKQLGLHNARICGSGTAPISPAILNWYQRLGIHISEGWGMTETSALAVCNVPFREDKIGTIGKPISGAEVKLSDAGEILIKSDGVIKEYYKEPEKTAEAIVDGWLHTGDKAEMDAEGYLRITGRVKDIFKSGKGKYVVPVPIESLLYENNLIEQVCVMGSGLPQPVAVVLVSAETSIGLSKEQIEQSLAQTLASTNTRLEGHEKLDRIIVTSDEWTIENGLLTPTLKIKRTELEQHYAEAIAIPSRDKVTWL